MNEIKKQLIDIAEGYEYWHARAERLEKELRKMEVFLQEKYPDEFKQFRAGIHSAVDLAIKLLRKESEEPHE